MALSFDFSGGTLPGGITFTRASIGTYFDNAGILKTAGNDVARLNYVGGVSCLLVEPSATNLLRQSNAFTTAPWGNSGAPTVLPNQFISPDGTNNGWSVAVSGANGGIYQDYLYSATQYTISIWARYLVNTAPTRLVICGGNIGGPFSTPSLTRLSYSGGANPVLDATLYQVFTSTNATNGYYGAQLETGGVMTSYIPTTTVAVTRAADSAAFNIPAGINRLVYTFDDGSTQTVSVSPGAYTIPTTLNRPNIRSVTGRWVYDFTTGSLPGGMTFSRPSIGTYFNNAGTLITASNDVARMNYVGGVSNLLIEGSATNLLLQSNVFNIAPWVAGSTSVITSAQFVSPDGANNGWTATSGTSFGGPYQLFTYSNVTYTSSAWVKQAASVSVDFSMNAIETVVPTTPTLTRLSGTALIPAGANVPSGVFVWTGSAGIVMGLYGAQMELGSKATSYIPTTTAAVTRAADAATFTIPIGVSQLTYTFDDGSTQTVTVAPGPYTIPTNLARPNIKTIAWTPQTTVPLTGPYQSLPLTANTPVQVTTIGTYNLAILNTGPGKLYISKGPLPGANTTSILVLPNQHAPALMPSKPAVWLSCDLDGGVSIATLPRQGFVR